MESIKSINYTKKRPIKFTILKFGSSFLKENRPTPDWENISIPVISKGLELDLESSYKSIRKKSKTIFLKWAEIINRKLAKKTHQVNKHIQRLLLY